MAPQKQVREIEIRVNTRGNPEIKKLASEFGKLNKGVKDFSTTLSTLKNAFFAIQGFSFAGIGLSTLTQTADALQKLTDRLTLSEGSLEAANIQLGKLGDVANATNSRIEDVATVYSRLNLSLRDAGVSSDALLATTQALQNTFRLSGATTAEATAATIQLSQGLASGQVRGQELRSVLEQNALVGEILAKKLGIARGELLKFAEKNGGIKASDVLGALADNFQDINDRASKLKPTISEGLDRAFNGLKIRLNEVNQEFALTEKAISAINFAASNLGGIAALGAAFGTYLALPKIITLLGYAATAIGTLVGALLGLGAAFVALNPLTIATVGIFTSLVSIFGLATVRSGVLSDAFRTMAGVFSEDLFPNVVKFLNYLSEVGVQADNSKDRLEKFSSQARDLFNDISGNNSPLKGIFDVDGESPIEKQINSLKRAAEAIDATKKELFDFKKEMSLINTLYLDGGISVDKYNKQLKDLEIKNLKQEFKEGSGSASDFEKKLKEITDGKAVKSTKLLELNLKQLNAQFFAGKVGIVEYTNALNNAEFEKLNRDVKEGKSNILDFQEAVRGQALRDFNQQLYAGTITMAEYNTLIKANEIDVLTSEVQSGTIALAEYDAKLISISEKFEPGSALRSGIQGYLESSGTLSQNIANGIESVFNKLEGVLFDFVKTGKFQFAQFTQAILDDLTKIIIKAAIIRPIADGILNFAAGAGGGAAASAGGSVTRAGGNFITPQADGGAWDKGTQFFANGGIVNRATPFGMSGGGLRVMGEAGPEAIVPLKRGKNGQLGVQSSSSNVQVNIINNAGVEIEQRETKNSNGDRALDVIITAKVKEAFSSGVLDRQMQSNYGLKRRGV